MAIDRHQMPAGNGSSAARRRIPEMDARRRFGDSTGRAERPSPAEVHLGATAGERPVGSAFSTTPAVMAADPHDGA